ncbi:outer membrane protein assembly factor BamB family protein [Haloplanus aerogenes]|uniref:Putative pyrroloquinoline-quinone binding quinoprotein n=1 Tax=Haloplanus aerogenes TaxID=660522 RepID=A0A3M0D9P5_9EURY|nr:PQQ-binding-like beta-propeller repeat protein [Haloplanus aerogenes]AZH26449.1 quinohemoprotein alcohol dehydrogenase [Haloplanus aerogenes]RMB18085.1 putative pyrroloquinoline-quinone binding quinoprotein [Haloplanus aerogenes]
MPSITRRTFLGTLAASASVGVAGCSSSCPDSDAPEPSVVVGTGEAGSGFETLPGGAWPSPRFDAGNTGHPPSRRPPTDPSLRWRTTLPAPRVDDARADASAPTVADGQVYLTTGAGAFALALRDGAERWHVDDLTPATTDHYGNELVPPVVDDGRVYVATGAGVVALHADDGTTAWRNTDAAAAGVPTVSGDTLFVPTADGLIGLATDDGSRRWAVDGVNTSLPAVADGTVVVGGEETVALDAATGDRRWSAPVRPEAHPVVADGTVYLGTYEGLVGLRLDDGSERWRVDRGSGRTFSAPVVTPETIYAVERPGEAPDATFALDRGGDGPPDPRWCSYVGDGAVAAAAGGHAFALQSGSSDQRPPPQLVAFTARFGEATWGYATAERPLPPALLDGALVSVTDRGTAVAFGGA